MLLKFYCFGLSNRFFWTILMKQHGKLHELACNIHQIVRTSNELNQIIWIVLSNCGSKSAICEFVIWKYEKLCARIRSSSKFNIVINVKCTMIITYSLIELDMKKNNITSFDFILSACFSHMASLIMITTVFHPNKFVPN